MKLVLKEDYASGQQLQILLHNEKNEVQISVYHWMIYRFKEYHWIKNSRTFTERKHHPNECHYKSTLQ
jgi:hypothetical protein